MSAEDVSAEDVSAEDLAERYAALRPRLLGVAYRVLGTLDEAEDVVQETWLRLQRTDVEEIRDLTAWCTTVAGRLALDALTSARARRESYVGPWLPEPIVGDRNAVAASAPPVDPAEHVTLTDSVSMALMVVLESLSPAERTSFVLHDVFGMEFDGVAEVVGRTPAACRQLAARARRHIRERTPRFDARPEEQRRVLDAFLGAAVGGDLGALLEVLDPDVVLRSDGGGLVSAARRPVSGADNVGRFLHGLITRQMGGPDVTAEVTTVNGAPGVVARSAGSVIAVLTLAVADGRVKEIAIVRNPEKLRRV
jgi:RNA polymerase sigma-70 factor (ECF subfamily)